MNLLPLTKVEKVKIRILSETDEITGKVLPAKLVDFKFNPSNFMGYWIDENDIYFYIGPLSFVTELTDQTIKRFDYYLLNKELVFN